MGPRRVRGVKAGQTDEPELHAGGKILTSAGIGGTDGSSSPLWPRQPKGEKNKNRKTEKKQGGNPQKTGSAIRAEWSADRKKNKPRKEKKGEVENSTATSDQPGGNENRPRRGALPGEMPEEGGERKPGPHGVQLPPTTDVMQKPCASKHEDRRGACRGGGQPEQGEGRQSGVLLGQV